MSEIPTRLWQAIALWIALGLGALSAGAAEAMQESLADSTCPACDSRDQSRYRWPVKILTDRDRQE